MKISLTEMETMQRMLGTIEGAVFGSKSENIVYDAVETINEILERAEVVVGGKQDEI